MCETESGEIRLKIIHVISELHPRLGGPPVIAASLAAAQARLGHDVHLLTHLPDDFSIVRGLSPHTEDVKFVPIESNGKSERIWGSETRRVMQQVIGQADIVHIHNVWEPMLAAAASVARRHRVPYVVLTNGMLDPWSLAQSAMKKKIAMMLYARRMLDKASALQVGNQAEIQGIAPLKLKSPMFELANGVWPQAVSNSFVAGSFRRELNLGDRPFILFLSRLHFKKGLDILLDAFDQITSKGRHPALHLVIAGPDDGYLQTARERIARSPARERIHLTGPIYHSEKFAALKDATCYCLPSRQEGFPVAVLEALGVGVPCVISTECHVDEAGQRDAAIITSLDPIDVANALDRVIGDESLRGRLSTNAQALVREKYIWPVIAQKCVEEYERIITGQS